MPFLIIVAFIVPVMVASFQAHKLLFSFDYDALEIDGQGAIDFTYFFQAEAIQLFFICFTFFVLSFIEAKYNKLDLRVVYKSSSWMEICSRFIIFFWCLFFLLTSETLLPTAGFCEKDDICTCEFDINKTQYGCNRNKTGMWNKSLRANSLNTEIFLVRVWKHKVQKRREKKKKEKKFFLLKEWLFSN